jgi:ubiquitin carboxyl-terminal hydrolase 25/28
VRSYRDQVAELDKKIELAYRDINKTPYYLYSLLIHEGSADTGHYYSYTYDLLAKKWRKYNDINVTEEGEEQVLREGKGLNAASAYYLVYAQSDVLLPEDPKRPRLSYRTSNDPDYLADAYSLLLSNDQRGQMAAENAQMHL